VAEAIAIEAAEAVGRTSGGGGGSSGGNNGSGDGGGRRMRGKARSWVGGLLLALDAVRCAGTAGARIGDNLKDGLYGDEGGGDGSYGVGEASFNEGGAVVGVRLTVLYEGQWEMGRRSGTGRGAWGGLDGGGGGGDVTNNRRRGSRNGSGGRDRASFRSLTSPPPWWWWYEGAWLSDRPEGKGTLFRRAPNPSTARPGGGGDDEDGGSSDHEVAPTEETVTLTVRATLKLVSSTTQPWSHYRNPPPRHSIQIIIPCKSATGLLWPFCRRLAARGGHLVRGPRPIAGFAAARKAGRFSFHRQAAPSGGLHR